MRRFKTARNTAKRNKKVTGGKGNKGKKFPSSTREEEQGTLDEQS